MPDEKDKTRDGWAMPEPVFRSTEGRDVKADPEADIPTEAANREFPAADAAVNPSAQTIRPKADRHIRHKNRRKKSFWEVNAKGLIVLGVLLLGLVIYLVWLYRGKIL
jgi:hypothetical protein